MDKKVAIITGASGGIGKAIATKLAANNFDLILTYYGSDEQCIQIKQNLETKYQTKVAMYQLNIAKANEVEDFYKTLKSDGLSFDVLVNNAGITNDMLVAKMKEEDFTSVIDTNLTGTFLMSKAALKTLSRKRSGAIVNISSVIGIRGNVGQANYAASKAGVIALSQSMAREYGRRNIRVNAVAPGFIESPMTEVLGEDYQNKIKENIALNRLGTAEEVANVVNFLSGDESSYITGQTIVIDGLMG